MNGVDRELFRPRAADPAAAARLGVAGRFVVAWCGTIGLAAGLDVVLRAAAGLAARGRRDVVFLLVGGRGAARRPAGGGGGAGARQRGLHGAARPGADSRGALVLGRLPRAPAGVEDLHDGHAVEDIRRRRDGPPRHPRGPRVRAALRRGRRLRPVHRAGGRGRTGLGGAAAGRRPGAPPAAGRGGPRVRRRVRPGAAGGAVPRDHRGRGAEGSAGWTTAAGLPVLEQPGRLRVAPGRAAG